MRRLFPTVRALALVAAATVIAAPAGRGLLEGGEGHPTGFGGIAGDVGSVALLLAAVLGGAIAWLLRGAHAVIDPAAGRRGAPAPVPRAHRPRLRPPAASPAVLALNLAGRAPPSRDS
jgi:hypothetical protein